MSLVLQQQTEADIDLVTPAEFLQSIVFDFAFVVPFDVSSASPPLEWISSVSLRDESPKSSLFAFGDMESTITSLGKSDVSAKNSGLISPPPTPVGKAKKKLYECSECPKVFTRAYALSSHMTIHSDEQPYTCSLCPTRFKRIWDMNRHEKKCANRKARRGTF